MRTRARKSASQVCEAAPPAPDSLASRFPAISWTCRKLGEETKVKHRREFPSLAKGDTTRRKKILFVLLGIPLFSLLPSSGRACAQSSGGVAFTVAPGAFRAGQQASALLSINCTSVT